MATFGKIVEDFLDSPIGQYLESHAKEEEIEALDALRTADAEEPKEIRKWQNQALVAHKILEWLAIAIHEGDMAMNKLKDEHDGD
jgi:hypothetical protein